MIKLVDLTISFGAQAVLKDASWMLGENDRASLVGENGSGKTTLLKIMAGLQDFDRGKLETSPGIKIGYLPQSDIALHGRSLWDEVSQAMGPVLALDRERKEIEARLDNPALTETERDGLIHRLAEVMDRFGIEDGYEIEAKVGRVLAGLGFADHERDRPVESFSSSKNTNTRSSSSPTTDTSSTSPSTESSRSTAESLPTTGEDTPATWSKNKSASGSPPPPTRNSRRKSNGLPDSSTSTAPTRSGPDRSTPG